MKLCVSYLYSQYVLIFILYIGEEGEFKYTKFKGLTRYSDNMHMFEFY